MLESGHAGLLAHLELLAVGQESQLGLVFLAGDEDRAIGDDRRAESVRPGDAASRSPQAA